jgi:glutamate racemase
MIGVFDSGHGGLTVLRALHERLPRQSFLYLGDHAHAPYGAKTAAEIIAFTRRGVEALLKRDCRLVILACNTASAVALRELQQTWLRERYPDRRVLGVLAPLVETIARNPWHAMAGPAEAARAPETVGVFATSATVESRSYLRETAKRAPNVRILQRACPELAGLIEAGAEDATLSPLVKTHVTALLGELKGAALDSAVLGCTHYPLIEHLFRAALPTETRIVSQPARVAEALVAYLFRHPEMKSFATETTPLYGLTTGDPARITALATRFFGRHLAFERLDSDEETRRHA